MTDFALAIVAFAREEPWKFFAVFGGLVFLRYGFVLNVKVTLQKRYDSNRKESPVTKPPSGDEDQ